jgi:hypothetical protein
MGQGDLLGQISDATRERFADLAAHINSALS